MPSFSKLKFGGNCWAVECPSEDLMNSFHFMSVLYLGLEMRNEKVAI
jgi:hypothetical protein